MKQRPESKVNYNMEADNVEVRLMFTPDPTSTSVAQIEVSPGYYREVHGYYNYAVIVRSSRFPRSKMIGEFKLDRHFSHNKVATGQKIGVLAGAVTEELNEKFGDDVNPENVARAAIDAYNEMMSEQATAFLQATN